MRRENTGPVIFFISAAIILYEITLSRIFSVLMWYHFVSFAVALALCGMAAGALFSINVGKMTAEESGSFSLRFLYFGFFSVLILYLLFFALSSYPTLGYRILSPLHQTYYEPFTPAGGAKGKTFFISIISTIILLSLPFVGGGAVFAACFEKSGNEFRTYFSAMTGSAAGVLLYLGALKLGSGPFALLLASILFLIPTIFLWKDISGKSKYLVFLLVIIIVLFAGNDLISHPADPKFVRGRYVPDILWSRWNAVSRVTVYPIADEELLKGFGQGKGYRGNPPRGLGMVVDDTGYTPIFEGVDNKKIGDFFKYNIASLPYLLKKMGKSLIIGPGGGKDIYCALSSGSFTVDAVEVNGLVVRAVQEVFGTFSGRPYTASGVTLHIREGRSFLGWRGDKYDVIQMTQVFGRIPPQAGAFTLTENHLYTVDSIMKMLGALNDGGILSVTRFAFEKTGPRLVNSVRAAIMKSEWGDPEKSILIAGSKGIMNVMAVRGGVDKSLIAKFEDECRNKGFDILYVPDRGGKGIIGRVMEGGFIRGDPGYDISPVTDDRPFFYYTLLPRDFFKGNHLPGKTTEEKGAYLVRKFLLFSLILSFLLPFAAVLFSGAKIASRNLAVLFASLLTGMGFITVEIILIKKLILPLGFPVYSLSCILLSVFFFSGIGSILFSFINVHDARKVVIASFFLAAILILYRFSLDRLSSEIVRFSILSKYIICFLISGLPGLFMGVPFPALLSIYNSYGGSKSVPVAINGFASVTGSMLALAVSMNLGYGISFLLAGGLYVLVALFSFKA